MASAPKLFIYCHCGAATQTVSLLRDQSSSASVPRDINLCHCAACRHNSGLLCVAHTWIERPDTVDGLVEYRSTTKGVSRFFCRTCGCHVFWRQKYDDHDGGGGGVVGNDAWAVATGVIAGFCGDNEDEFDRGDKWQGVLRFARHINAEGTRDGGATVFMKHMEVVCEGKECEGVKNSEASEPKKGGENIEGKDVLNAFCHCGKVRFHITRPNSESRLPRSNYPDLLVPYYQRSPRIQNPEDEKWWLRSGTNGEAEPRRYLAGTCVCYSCRLTSGHEIQTWAFVPRANIFFHVSNDDDDNNKSDGNQEKDTTTTTTVTEIPLDFDTLPAGILSSYESSEGVRREFCTTCGATVFWRDRWRPEIIDVSVGLLDAEEGARAETWLDWWTRRVSFGGDVKVARPGVVGELVEGLIVGLAEGLARWGGTERSQFKVIPMHWLE